MSKQPNGVLTIGFSKEARIAGPLRQLLQKAGYDLGEIPKSGFVDISPENGDPVRLEFARGNDLCEMMRKGIVAAALMGRNVVEEFSLNTRDTNFQLVASFADVAPCRLVVAAPQELKDRFDQGWWPTGLRYATSYPALTQSYLASMDADGSNVIIPMDGTVEASIRRGQSDIIVDMVNTGETLKANNLVKVETIGQYNAVLVTYERDKRASPKRTNPLPPELTRFAWALAPQYLPPI
jgi:ATP phosphoribosyltransferase